ncbi:hypothetical protein LSAT2_019810 [Lamellibrachia satsuma]|nr:hypothetical protein LSAT2_019810 [Lamellibrachia satsuma]
MPCQNGGTCSELGSERTCKCVGSFSGDSCEQSMTASLPRSKIKRVAINVRLLKKTFTKTLNNKNSNDYKKLKTDVVVSLKTILDEKIGAGKYRIVDVTFSAGSVVVAYMLELPKDDPVLTQSAVVNAIKEYNGTIAGSDIDPHSLNASWFPWVPVLLGVVLGIVLLVAGTVLIVYIARKCRRINYFDESDSDYSATFSPPFKKRQMFWQERSAAMSGDPTTATRDQSDNVTSRTVKNMANFSSSAD